ncbi:MAG: hypothetical protein ABR523_06105 [Desulfurivibrionaceae bacterium]
MLRKKILPLVALSVLVPSVALAQTDVFKQGTQEFTLGGSGTSDENLDNPVFGTTLSWGIFTDQHMEWAVRQELNYNDLGGSSNFNGSTRLAYDYHFGTGQLVPLLGLSVGYVYGDNVNDQFIAGPEGGLKFFVNDTTFIYGLVEYQFLFEDADDVDEVYDDGRFVYGLGLGFTF